MPRHEARLPNAHGLLERLEEQGGALVVRGWCLLADGPFDGGHARVDGTGPLPSRTSVRFETLERQDVAARYPHVPRAEASGFEVVLPLPRPSARDEIPFEIPFEIIGERAGVPRARLAGAFYRESRALE